MKTTFTVRRSPEWLAEQRLARCENTPESINVEVELSDLSTEARGMLLSYSGGSYSTCYRSLNYTSGYQPSPGSLHGSEYFRVDSDSPTAAQVNAEVLAAFARIDGKRVAAEQERAAQEVRDRALAAEWAALPLEQRASNNGSGPRYCRDATGQLSTFGEAIYPADVLQKFCPDAWAEARDRSAVNFKLARGERAIQDRETLARFLAAIPDDALRGALKRLAHTEDAVEALRNTIEDASPFPIFTDDEADE